MKLPVDMFKHELLPYLTVRDIVNLDCAIMNHEYRDELMQKIGGMELIEDFLNISMGNIPPLLKWLGLRGIFISNMRMRLIHTYRMPKMLFNNNNKDQFKLNKDVNKVVIHSIEIHDCHSYRISDDTIQKIAQYCIGLQSLSIFDCRAISDAGLINISQQYPKLLSLKLYYCVELTDASIISISTHCTGLQSLKLGCCRQITDESIISISSHCTGLLSLNLAYNYEITDASIISISTHCTGLQSLNLIHCDQVTDESILAISTHCTRLQSLNLKHCYLITDASIISISTHCTTLQSLNLDRCNLITDQSIIAISTHCTGLQSLCTQGCDRLSIDELRCNEFKSVSELQAVLLSITDVSALEQHDDDGPHLLSEEA